jgi:hypothetical protein
LEPDVRLPELKRKKTSTSDQSTVSLFLKTHRMFKKVLGDVKCLEEHFQLKLPFDVTTHEVRGAIISAQSSSELGSTVSEQ